MKITIKDRIKPFLNEDIDSDSVLQAIRNKNKVRIRYDDTLEDNGGNSKGSRVIMPMAIGTTKKGYPVLRAYQEGGGSRRGIPKWKFFRLDRITSWIPLKNKKFFQAPDGYNYDGDRTMGTFIDNAKFDDFVSPLDRERYKFNNDVKVANKGTQGGPIKQQPRVTQQWKKNVYTSQPNSKKYDTIRKNIEATPKKDEDFWKLFDLNDAENTMTQNQQGPIDNNNQNDYESDDVDFDENDFLNKNMR